MCLWFLPVSHVYSGAFSEVLFAKNRETKEEFAIKCIDKKLLDGKLDSLDSEITILKQ